MTAHEEHRDPSHEDAEYDGMDALMAAILDEPLPAGAAQDPALAAAHRAAVADIGVLRERLALIGDALAGPAPASGTPDAATAGLPAPKPTDTEAPGTPAAHRAPAAPEDSGAPAGHGEAAGRERAGEPSGRGESDDGGAAGVRPGRDGDGRSGGGSRPQDGARSGGGAESRQGAGFGGSAAARSGVRGPGGGGPPGTGGGSRGPHRRRRPLRVALGALAAAAAATVVVGMGWLVAQPGGGLSGSAEDSAAAQSDAKEAAGVAFGSPRYLACARLVAEGTVLAVEPAPGAGAERVTLAVSRYHKGGGGDEVTFLRDPAAGDPPLHDGDRVLIGMPVDGVHPDAVVVGEADIAAERARIIASLPESRTLSCG
ncbi:hypothetical protein ACI2LV_07080 [Streptomyces fungicidicus]|uniref:hypothetical protein n=1 Tax=Streptomyces fungicidicus TaxID=68203 RepID=UPI00384DC3B3